MRRQAEHCFDDSRGMSVGLHTCSPLRGSVWLPQWVTWDLLSRGALGCLGALRSDKHQLLLGLQPPYRRFHPQEVWRHYQGSSTPCLS